MKTKLFIAISALLLLAGFIYFKPVHVGAQSLRILTGPGGGTGIGTAAAGNIGNCLSVASINPLVYTFTGCAGGSGGSGAATTSFAVTYPLTLTTNVSQILFGIAFGTTTQNFWSAYNNFTSLFATNASSTNATTTGSVYFTGLTGSGGELAIDANNRVYKAATTTFSTGLTYTAGAVTVNTSQNISTLSNLTSNGFVKTSGGTGALSIDTNTYTTTGTTLTIAGTANQITSSAGAQDLSANRSWTLSLPNHVIQPSLLVTTGSTTNATTTGSQYFGFLTGSAASCLYVDTNGKLQGTGAACGTGGGGITSIGPAGALQTGPSVTLATSSTAFNGLTASTTITASGNTITYANTLAGLLGYGGGGTGTTTAPLSQLLYGGASAYQSVATSSFTPSAEFTIGGTLGALVGGANSTLTLATGGVALTKLATQAANTVLVNQTSGAASPTALATSTFANTLHGVGTNGFVLAEVSGVPTWVATTTFSAPLAYSAGNVTCTNASAGVTGCLTGTDWSTFNNKQATIAVTAPLRLTGATIDWTGLATTSQPSSSNILVSNGLAGVYGVATSTATLGLGLSGSLTGLGSSNSLSIATSSLYSGTAGQALVFTGTNAIGASSTLSVAVGGTGSSTSLSGILAGNGFGPVKSVVIGSNLTFDGTTLSATGGGGGSFPFSADNNFNSVVYSTSTPTLWFKSGLYASSTSYLDAVNIAGLANGCLNITNGLVGSSGAACGGTGSQSPWTQNIDGGNFNLFNVNSTGIGTSTPFVALQVATTTGKNLVLSDTGAGANLKHWLFSSRGGNLYIASTSDTYATSSLTSLALVASSTGSLLGVNIGAPRATLDLYETGGTGASPSILLGGNANGDTDFWISRISNNDGLDNDSLRIGTTSVPGQGTQFTFTNKGSFGINTTAPNAALGISTDTPNKAVLLSVDNKNSSAGGGGSFIEFTGADGIGLPFSTQIGGTDNFDVYLNAGGTPGQFGALSMRINGSNNATSFYTRTSTFTVASTSVATVPLFQVDGSTANSANGLLVKSSASGSGVALSVQSLGTNDNLSLNAKGSGTITFGNVSTGGITMTRATVFNVSAQSPLLFGGTTAGGTLTLEATNSAAPTTAAMTLRTSALAGVTNPTMTFTTNGIGVGTTSPHQVFTIASSTGPQLTVTDGSANQPPFNFRTINGNFYIATSSVLDFSTTTNPVLTVLGSGGVAGFVGIASSTPWRSFSVNGTIAWQGGTVSGTGNAVCLAANGEVVDGGGGTCTPSSIRFKQDVRKLDISALDLIAQLNPVTFRYKKGYGDEGKQERIGLVAEDVEKVDNRLVEYAKDGSINGLHFEEFAGLYAKAFQEQQAEIDALKSGTITVTTKAARSAEENWQWALMGLLVVWNLYLTVRRKK